MPQMAPLSWFTLYLIFSIMFMIFMMMNFYQTFNQISIENKVKMMKTINWKW